MTEQVVPFFISTGIGYQETPSGDPIEIRTFVFSHNHLV
jgi:hypothetical protein